MTSDRRASSPEELAAIACDPAMRRLAWRLAGGMADDLLQETWYAMARTAAWETIENPRGYFYRTMVNTWRHLRQDLARHGIPADNLALLPDDRDLLLLRSGNFESKLHALLREEGWLTPFRNERDKLAALVPRRSKDSGRYRAVIIAAAEKILHMVTEGDVDREDWPAILKSAYPEWFAEPDAPRQVSARRLQDARKDVRTLLQVLAQREHLIGPPNERARPADDAILGALFLKAEQILLMHEMPYDLEQGLQMFTEWLDDQPQSRR